MQVLFFEVLLKVWLVTHVHINRRVELLGFFFFYDGTKQWGAGILV